MTILSLILMLITSNSEIRFPYEIHQRRAFIIGIDGIGTLPKIVDTPGIHRIINEGVYTYEGQTVYPSLSTEAWTSLLHGVGPEKHQYITTFEKKKDTIICKKPDFTFPLTSPYPSIFRLIYEKDNQSKMACFSNWDYLPKNIVENGINVFKYFSKSEKKLVNQFEKYMRKNDPCFVFIQLDDVDSAGHIFGYFTDGQKNQLMKTDKSVSRIIDIIEKYDSKHEDLILILSDHGGGGDFFSEHNISKPSFCPNCMHGSKDPADMTIFWSARGKGICKSKKIEHQVSIKDTVKFVASYLNLKIPESWDGYDHYPELRCQ